MYLSWPSCQDRQDWGVGVEWGWFTCLLFFSFLFLCFIQLCSKITHRAREPCEAPETELRSGVSWESCTIFLGGRRYYRMGEGERWATPAVLNYFWLFTQVWPLVMPMRLYMGTRNWTGFSSMQEKYFNPCPVFSPKLPSFPFGHVVSISYNQTI